MTTTASICLTEETPVTSFKSGDLVLYSPQNLNASAFEKDKSILVLVTKDCSSFDYNFEGVVVWSKGDMQLNRPVGFTSTSWGKRNFVPFKGTVTIKSE
jgi:D-mannonate dehydratase